MPSSLVIRIFMPVLNERNELTWVVCSRYRILPKQAMQSQPLVLLGREANLRPLSRVRVRRISLCCRQDCLALTSGGNSGETKTATISTLIRGLFRDFCPACRVI